MQQYGVYGRKPTVLDAMNLLSEVWSDDSKYCTNKRKVDILSASLNADINNSVGSATMSICDKTVTPTQCKELCNLLGKITLISKEHHEQNGTQPPAIQESLIDDQGKALTSEELETVISNWIELKDDPIILEA
jgi:hypothetical protein